MQSPTFILEGIGGVFNYGCEAQVRGTAAILRRLWPRARIIYRSYRPEADRPALADADIEVGDGTTRRGRVSRFIKRARSRLGLPRQGDGWRYNWVRKADCVLSIGGDILTLWPNQMDKDTVEFPQARHITQIVDKGKPVVLWGASVGPFEENPHAVGAFSEPLGRLSLITARETLTRDYLAGLGVASNVGLAADPAFTMAPCGDDDPLVERHGPRPGSQTLGVNLSPLSADYVFGESERAQMPQMQAATIVRIIDTLDVDVLLIPHVICPWRPADDDYGYLQKVATAIPDRLARRVALLPPGLGARRTKAIIGRCRALLAARMHCAIAGMSSDVPTLLLSYSPKAVGMCEYVYGHREMVLPLDAGEDALLAAVQRMLRRAAEIRRQLENCIPAVQQDAFGAGELLKKVLSNGSCQWADVNSC